jgi:hypothetical protein
MYQRISEGNVRGIVAHSSPNARIVSKEITVGKNSV